MIELVMLAWFKRKVKREKRLKNIREKPASSSREEERQKADVTIPAIMRLSSADGSCALDLRFIAETVAQYQKNPVQVIQRLEQRLGEAIEAGDPDANEGIKFQRQEVLDSLKRKYYWDRALRLDMELELERVFSAKTETPVWKRIEEAYEAAELRIDMTCPEVHNGLCCSDNHDVYSEATDFLKWIKNSFTPKLADLKYRAQVRFVRWDPVSGDRKCTFLRQTDGQGGSKAWEKWAPLKLVGLESESEIGPLYSTSGIVYPVVGELLSVDDADSDCWSFQTGGLAVYLSQMFGTTELSKLSCNVMAGETQIGGKIAITGSLMQWPRCARVDRELVVANAVEGEVANVAGGIDAKKGANKKVLDIFADWCLEGERRLHDQVLRKEARMMKGIP